MSSDDVDLRSASKAVKDAAAALNRMIKETVSSATTQAGREIVSVTQATSQASREIADELRQATKEINEAVHGVGLTRSGRNTKAEQTRMDLLVAAARVFAEKGYEGASVGDIASAAGYTKGALYANFASKEDLLMSLARQSLTDDDGQADEMDLYELFASCRDSQEHTQRTLLGLELYLYAIRHPETRKDLQPLLAQTHDHLAKLVHRTRNPDAFDDPSDADRDTAFALVALHTFAEIMACLTEDSEDPIETNAMLKRLVDRLL